MAEIWCKTSYYKNYISTVIADNSMGFKFLITVSCVVFINVATGVL